MSMSIPKSTVQNVRNRLSRHKERRVGTTKKKVLLLLLGGLALGLSGSPRTSWRVIGAMTKEWRELTKQAAERAINSLYASKLVDARENSDGTLTLVLAEKGRKRALTYDFSRMKVKKPARWDELWRLFTFDVPIPKKEVRDGLRERFLALGFCELQQSVFIYPYDCSAEVEYLVELYDARKYVRSFLVSKVDNELHLKKFFRME